MSDRVFAELEAAWDWRAARGILGELEAVRVFYGPGEGSGGLRSLAVDRFGSHYWITQWEEKKGVAPALSKELEVFLTGKGASSAVSLWRPEKGVPAEPEILFGVPPADKFQIVEDGVRFWVQLLGVRHPGLFLDHLPLRQWLRVRSRGWRVLNCFAYTGSLSIAACLGGASHVCTLDLSKPAVRWAEENWKLNSLSSEVGKFIAGDVFEWLPRLKRQGEKFDCVILDPPSFSRGEKGSFSTAKDLKKLHELVFGLLSPGGFVVSSINSAGVSMAKFEADVLAAAVACGRRCEVLRRIELPETFPTRLEEPGERYLKGVILRVW